MEQLSLKDVSAQLGVKACRVEYLLQHGLVPEPQLRISGRRVFSPKDVANIRARLAKKPAAKAPVEPMAEAAGM